MKSSDRIGLAIRGAKIAQLALMFLEVPWIGVGRQTFVEIIKALKDLDAEITRIERESSSSEGGR